MNNNPAFTLLVITQLLRALVSSTAQQNPMTYMPVPQDNVTVAGLASDVQVMQRNLDPYYIAPMSKDGFVVPTTSAAIPTTTGLNPNVSSAYSICPGYPNGGAPSNAHC